MVRDGSLIGLGSTLTTLNHGIDPTGRPIAGAIGRKVWLRARGDGRPRRDNRGRRHNWSRLGRDQGPSGQHDRRWRTGQARPSDGLRRLSKLSWDRVPPQERAGNCRAHNPCALTGR